MKKEYDELLFGVEVEMTNISRARAANIIGGIFKSEPIKLGNSIVDLYQVFDNQKRIWRIVNDNTIIPQAPISESKEHFSSYKVELVTPILKYKDIELLQIVVMELGRAGAITNKSTGVHIHIGAEDFTPSKLRILCNIVYSKQLMLKRALLCYSSREEYCEDLSEDLINKLNMLKPKNYKEFSDIWYNRTSLRCRRNDIDKCRYRILNISNILTGKMKTIELRLFNSTVDHDLLKSYVQLSLLIAARAINLHRASSKINVPENGNDKYRFRVWLLGLGAISNEFKTMRGHLLKNLKGNSAWRN